MKHLRCSVSATLVIVLFAGLMGSATAADTSAWTAVAPPDLNVSILFPDAPTSSVTDTTDNGTGEHRRVWQDVSASYTIFVGFSVYGAKIDPVSTEANVWGGFLSAASSFVEDARRSVTLDGVGGMEFVGHSPAKTVLMRTYVENSGAFAIVGIYASGDTNAEDIVRTALDSARITGTFPIAIPDSTPTS